MYYRLELTMYYYCLWYDKLWGPSQRVVTLFRYDDNDIDNYNDDDNDKVNDDVDRVNRHHI